MTDTAGPYHVGAGQYLATPTIVVDQSGNIVSAGAVTIVDGGSVTLGAKADTAITDSTTTNTIASFLKGVVKILADVWDATNHRLLASVNGDTAAGAADGGNPVKAGFVGRTTLPTAVTDGQRANGISDKMGRQVAVLGTVRDLRAIQTTTISASTAETTIVSQIASTFADLIALVISNTSTTTDTRIDFRDTTAGTILFSIQAPRNSVVGFSVPGSTIPQTTVNTNWTAQCGTSTTDIRILAIFEKNK